MSDSQYVLVFNRSTQPIAFFKAKPIVETTVLREVTVNVRDSFTPITLWPGLTLVSREDADAVKLDHPSNPHLDRALRVLRNPLDLGEGDAVHAARACGDLRVLRWMGGLPWHSHAVSKAIADRIAEIESGVPRTPERRTAELDSGEDYIDLGEA